MGLPFTVRLLRGLVVSGVRVAPGTWFGRLVASDAFGVTGFGLGYSGARLDWRFGTAPSQVPPTQELSGAWL